MTPRDAVEYRLIDKIVQKPKNKRDQAIKLTDNISKAGLRG
jgi:hypothetical protein